MKRLSFREIFPRQDRESIVAAIAAAEAHTSGEIRVYVERTTDHADVMERARDAFKKLKMDQTFRRNGVLFYVAVEDRKCAILGDRGIHEKVGGGFWEQELEVLKKYFREQRFSEGLKEAILLAGEQLAAYFPPEEGDVNELDDDIYFEEN